MTSYVLWTLGVIVAVAVFIAWFCFIVTLLSDGYYVSGIIAGVLLTVVSAVGLGWLFWYTDGGDRVPDTGVVTDREFHDPAKGSASWSLRITDPADLNEGWVRVSSEVFNGCQFGDRWPDCSVGAS